MAAAGKAIVRAFFGVCVVFFVCVCGVFCVVFFVCTRL